MGTARRGGVWRDKARTLFRVGGSRLLRQGVAGRGGAWRGAARFVSITL